MSAAVATKTKKAVGTKLKDPWERLSVRRDWADDGQHAWASCAPGHGYAPYRGKAEDVDHTRSTTIGVYSYRHLRKGSFDRFVADLRWWERNERLNYVTRAGVYLRWRRARELEPAHLCKLACETFGLWVVELEQQDRDAEEQRVNRMYELEQAFATYDYEQHAPKDLFDRTMGAIPVALGDALDTIAGGRMVSVERKMERVIQRRLPTSNENVLAVQIARFEAGEKTTLLDEDIEYEQ